MQKKILITGGTGFIGSYLISELGKDHDITILTRDVSKHKKRFINSAGTNNNSNNRIRLISDLEELPFEYDIIINLAGHPISCAWSQNSKKIIYDSRIETTKALTKAIRNASTKPELFISGSAIGYYGAYPSGPEKGFTEEDITSQKNSFSANLCRDWEQEASSLKDIGIRICILRTGIVLGKGGGIITKMLPSFKYFLGASLASGEQSMSWIHIQDLIRAIKFILENKNLDGSINLTSPTPVNNSEFTTALGDAIFRPVLLKIPSFFLRTIFGQMADELLIKGQKVLPKKLLDHGYKFTFKNIDDALRDILYSRSN